MEKISQIQKKLLKKRQADSHKGTFGHGLVIAGSVNLTGAAYLTCMGALRTGIGLVTAFVPESIKPIISTLLPEALIIPVSQTEKGNLSIKDFSYILEHSKKVEILALGPGIGQDEDTSKLVKKIITTVDLPMIIDADGLNIISHDLSILEKVSSDVILTPHPGEMSRLVNKSVEDIQKNRMETASLFAQDHGVTVILKGNDTVIADSVGNNWINPTGNSGMATGGTGDILTGMITSMIAQGLVKFEGSRLAAYLHGLAGNIAAEEKSKISLLPRDLINHIPTAIKHLSSQK